MYGWQVLERAAELERRGEAFALATVVWRQGPSSGQLGSRAIITTSGELLGWIGGACAEPSVIRQACQVIADGQPRLLLLGTPDQLPSAARFDGPLPEGMTVVPISCQSEGALEVYVEPVLPMPHLVVVGRSPMAQALADLAAALGWRAGRIDWQEFSAADVDERTMVVVATQGHGDEEAIERAAAARPDYLGLVASRKRGAAVLGYLAERGVPKEQLDRVRAPAGLTWVRPRMSRSPSRSWPSWCSFGRPARLACLAPRRPCPRRCPRCPRRRRSLPTRSTRCAG